ncbi:MAG TPA: hypothetical protein VGW10_14055 [Solirubrobacteraceae bacterium]|nr:hypothetical protein [Solirubrobacteraceae bacterium]
MLLHGSHPLPDGGRVRLRLPLAHDRPGVHELLADLRVEAEELEVRRALRCVPGRRIAVCATAWDGWCDRIVGFGALDVADGAMTLLGPRDVTEVLEQALREHAGAWSRRVA